MFGPKIRLSRELFERCKRHAAANGYGSVEEFVIHVLEKEMRRNRQPMTPDEEDIAIKRLRGLGYLD